MIERFSHAFDEIPDAYLRERAADIRDVGRRVLEALLRGGRRRRRCDIPEGSVVVADELLPSVTAHLELGQVRGFVTDRGGQVLAHARSWPGRMGTPAVAGIGQAPPRRSRTGDQVIVDGVAGRGVREPRAAGAAASTTGWRRSSAATAQALHQSWSISRRSPPTARAVTLLANVSKFPDTEAALAVPGRGHRPLPDRVRLLGPQRLPHRGRAIRVPGRGAAQRLHPRPVTFRLLDLGGDKQLPYFPLPSSRNPSLADAGHPPAAEAPRSCCEPQLRAFLRVSADHPVSVLLPVVGGAGGGAPGAAR